MAYQELLADVQAGAISPSRVENAYSAIQVMKERVAGAQPSAAAGASGSSSYPENVGAPETIQPEKGAG